MLSIILLSVTFQTFAGVPEFCERIVTRVSGRGDMSVNGVLLARTTKRYPETVISAYRKLQNTQLQNQRALIPTEGGELLMNLATTLAENTGIQGYLEEPLTFYVAAQAERTYGNRPNASMTTGILGMNRNMLDLVQNDDELAEVVGHELLHFTLRHDLAMVQFKDSPFNEFLRKRSIGSVMAFFTEQTPWGNLLNARANAIKQWAEDEVDAALPVLLTRSGFDPWAAVDVYARELEVMRNAAPVFMDGYEKMMARKRIAAISARLERMGIQRRPQRSTALLNQLHQILETLP